jgi:hypothetical protein
MNVGRQLDDGRDRGIALASITMGAGKTVKAETGPVAATSERNDRRDIVEHGLNTKTPRGSPHKTPSTSCGLQRCRVSPHCSGERPHEIGRVRDTGEQPPHRQRSPEGHRWRAGHPFQSVRTTGTDSRPGASASSGRSYFRKGCPPITLHPRPNYQALRFQAMILPFLSRANS